MLTDHTVTVRTVKLPADIMPDSGRYPHYRLVPLTGTDNRYCLFFSHQFRTLPDIGSIGTTPPYAGTLGQNAGTCSL